MSWSNIRESLEDQIAYKGIYKQRDQRGKINHKAPQFQIGKNSGERSHQGCRCVIDPSNERGAKIDNKKLEYESEQQQKLDNSKDNIYQCSNNSIHKFDLYRYYIFGMKNN
jgi:hypothetical protein